MFGATRSGRIYRNEGSEELETSPLISPPRGERGRAREGFTKKCDQFDKAENSTHTTSTYTTTSFTIFTSIFTHTTSTTTTVQYGKRDKVASVQRSRE